MNVQNFYIINTIALNQISCDEILLLVRDFIAYISSFGQNYYQYFFFVASRLV